MNKISIDLKSENSLEDIQRLIYGISHDLGASLRAVVQFSRLLEKRIDNKLDEKERYWLQLIREGGEKGQIIVNTLLTHSQLPQSQSHFASDVFSGNRVVKKIIDNAIKPKEPTTDCSNQPIEVTVTTPVPVLCETIQYWHNKLSLINNDNDISQFSMSRLRMTYSFQQ